MQIFEWHGIDITLDVGVCGVQCALTATFSWFEDTGARFALMVRLPSQERKEAHRSKGKKVAEPHLSTRFKQGWAKQYKEVVKNPGSVKREKADGTS